MERRSWLLVGFCRYKSVAEEFERGEGPRLFGVVARENQKQHRCGFVEPFERLAP